MQTKGRKYFLNGVTLVILLILTFLFLIPILWVIGSSFKSTGELFSWPPSLIGKNPSFFNYQKALEEGHFGIYFFNTVFTSVAATFLTIVVNVMSGYAFAKYRFKGDKILFGIVLATLMIPLEVIMIPIFKVIVATGLYNSLWGLIIPAVASPTAVLLVRQYYVGIPSSVWHGSENPNNLFCTGQVAMYFSGSWMIANYKDQITDFEWGGNLITSGGRVGVSGFDRSCSGRSS